MTLAQFKFSEDLDDTRFHCGIDVHKNQMTVTIHARDDSDRDFYKTAVFGTDPRALDEFFSFASKYRPVKFAIEATNVYHHVVSTFLEEKKNIASWHYDLLVLNPADATGIPGRKKTDKVDSRDIARYLRAGLLKGGKVVITPLDDLRAIFRSAARLERDKTALKNRIKKNLDRGGFSPAGLNFNTQWARDLVYHVSSASGTIGECLKSGLESGGDLFHHATYIRKNWKRFEKYLDVKLSPGQNALVRQDMVELEFKTARLSLLAVEIDKIVATRPALRKAINDVATVPGISSFSAAWLVAEVGHASKYKDVGKFLSYCGCCPKAKVSNEKVYSVHVNKHSNKYARTMLFQAAQILCNVVKKDSALKHYATRVLQKKRDRGLNLAYCIVAAKMVRIIYAILRDGVPFSTEHGRNNHVAVAEQDRIFSKETRKAIRKALVSLKRVSKLKELSFLSDKTRYFAGALERSLK